MIGLYWDYIRVYKGIYGDYKGIMEKRMETTKMGYGAPHISLHNRI